MAVTPAFAEDQLEYKMDIGGGLGLCFYMGDANGTPFKGSSVMTSFDLRRNFNPRMALRFGLSYGRFTGNTSGRYFPVSTPTEGTTEQMPLYGFAGNVVDLGAQFELNFWGYGIGPGYKKLKRITPYILVGLGATIGRSTGSTTSTDAATGVRTETPVDGTTCIGMNIPVGVGVKYKIKPRLNLALEWTFRFTTTDRLDGDMLCDPYHVQSGFLKNKDTYSYFKLTLSYDICPKLRRCNN